MSRNLMIVSSIFMGFMGMAATFFPEEFLTTLQNASSAALVLFVQITGALYVGFALMNWMAKTVLIGGIYARPLAMGNFAHFAIAAIAIIKMVFLHESMQYLWVVAVIYSIFAILFGVIFFTNPGKK